MESLFKVIYHFENVPKFMQGIMEMEFMRNRSKIVDICNNYMDEVNKAWNLTGKPTAFGDYAEDINPEYVDFMKERIQPKIDILNESFPLVNYRIDEIGDIVGYVPAIKKSKIFITLEEVKH